MIHFPLILCLVVWNVAPGNSARCRNYSSCDVACNFPCVISSICASPCGNKSSNHHGSQSNHGSDNGNHGGNFGSKGGNHGLNQGNHGSNGGNFGLNQGNHGSNGGNFGSNGGNHGQYIRNYGPQGGNYGPYGGNYGPQWGNYGPQAVNYGSQGGNYGVQGGIYGPQGGNFGQQGGNYGPQGGNYGPQGGNYGPQGGNYGPQGGNYGPQGGNYGPQGGNYGPQGGNYGPEGGNYGPQGGDIGPQGGNYICGHPCGNNGNDIERDLEFTTISKGYSSGVQDRVYEAFSSTSTWASFWTSHTSNSSPARAAPLIDFDLNIVIAAFRGTRSTGGYGVEITKVRETRDALVVHVETRDPDPSSLTTQAFTQPFHLVQCERLGESKPVKFVEEQWVPPPPAKYTFTVLFEKDEDAADVLKDVKSLNFVISVQLLEAIKIGIVTVDAALVEGPDAANTLIKQVDGIKIVEQD